MSRMDGVLREASSRRRWTSGSRRRSRRTWTTTRPTHYRVAASRTASLPEQRYLATRAARLKTAGDSDDVSTTQRPTGEACLRRCPQSGAPPRPQRGPDSPLTTAASRPHGGRGQCARAWRTPYSSSTNAPHVPCQRAKQAIHLPPPRRLRSSFQFRRQAPPASRLRSFRGFRRWRGFAGRSRGAERLTTWEDVDVFGRVYGTRDREGFRVLKPSRELDRHGFAIALRFQR
jgi:hypothetical protein